MIFIVFLVVIGIYYMYLATQTAFLGEDEAAYITLGKQILNLNYAARDFWGNPNTTPPFIPLFYAVFFSLFGSSLSIAKIVSTLFGILTLFFVFLLGKKINIYVGIFSVFILLLMSLFTHFMLIAYVDVPIAFFSVLSLYLISEIKNKKSAVLAGLIIGISYYVKESGLFIALALLLYSFILYLVQRDKNKFKFYILATIISLALISISIVRNVLLFGYPYSILFNIFFPSPTTPTWFSKLGAGVLSPSIAGLNDYAGIFGLIPLFLAIFSIIYIFIDRKNIKIDSIFFSTFLFILFLVISILLYAAAKLIADARYFMIILPQLALVEGFYLWKLKDYKKYLLVIIVPILVFSLYSSVTTAISTSQTQRFPTDYVDALTWIKNNTPKDSLIFTTYGGTTRYFADRNNFWQDVKEFPDVMTTTNSTFIYQTLKKYNISYILIWRGVLAQDYIIPQSNIIGVFTYNFLNTVVNDTQHFNVTYQNQDNIILKLV